MQHPMRSLWAGYSTLALAFLLVGVFPVLNQFWLFPLFEEIVFERAEQESVRVGQHLGQNILPGENGQLDTQAVRNFITTHKQDFNVHKLRFFSADGTIAYSTDEQEIGQVTSADYFHQIVAGGEIYRKVVRKHGSTAEGAPIDLDVAETYVPFMAAEGGAFLGAFEVYLDITQSMDRLRGLRTQANLLAVGIGFLLLLLAYFLNAMRVRAVGRIEDSERAYRALLEQAPDGVAVFDETDGLHEVNSALGQLFGLDARRMLAEPEGLRLVPRGSETPRPLAAFLTNGKEGAREASLRRGPDEIPLELSTSRLQDGRSMLLVRDVTERKRAEEILQLANVHLEHKVAERTSELKHLNSRLRAEIVERAQVQSELELLAQVFKNTIEGITITDPDGVILKVNPAFTAITGYSEEEARGQTPRILKSGKHDEAFYEKLWQGLTNEYNWAGEIWNRRKDGESYPSWLSISAIRGDSGKLTHFIGVFHDISDVKRSEKKASYLAYHDALTGLPNRLLYMDRLRVALRHAERQPKEARPHLAVFFMDLDNFKNVNDSLGHYVGDQLLTAVAERLSAKCRAEDTVARFGGDEFVMLAENVERPEEALHLARRVLSALDEPVRVGEHELYVSGSVGVTIYPEDGATPEELIKNADMAMYCAKEQGKAGFQLYAPTMHERARRRMALENDLRQAVETESFEVYYQPKIRLTDGVLIGAEALVRWRREDGELISPMEFIPVAEETGLIRQIGLHVLKKACRQAVLWRAQNPELTMAVNISAVQMRDTALPAMILDVLTETGLAPEALELEITETSIMQDVEGARVLLEQLAGLGVSLAVDDFGTGYSSLYYLKKFPIRTLKIDRTFVKDLASDADDAAIVSSVVLMARAMQMNVVAEGVETEEALARLTSLGCELAQGYYFSPPVPADAFCALGDRPFTIAPPTL